ncbi:MAG TPA: aminoacyl-histidine dipeptidase [Lachnospiraceae bacterium]|nr:aminoacyl-histidine dipeptidase [Lachnospiraceae bacterium]HBY73045.1 aminoacyl-histidine dipeptidase [Lachnospiraceae bacterium]HCA70644.1 aminoacyl-histidine dipeptidase [Lachnospiraceae bacterium]HCM13949.1 aminoacyl-histidine dipeptidase [Lachnospiraceae bacterium]HCR40890.1 aminoacyl-histidine dipeptidase [Lachnospiraceae bacterium]
MNSKLEQLDYKGIFKYFEEIAQIPRESGNEGEISNYLVSFAKQNKLEYTQDSANNVIIIKEATPGFEQEPGIILQGHMDMVCEKVKENTHDFLKDPIKLIVDGDDIHADGTTLGADNGIAVAYILAVLSDETLKHPRLEAVITTDEEVGMKGARALDASILQGKYMINLDSEEEGYLLCSCAGGISATGTLPVKRESKYGKSIKVAICGLKGGHSGSDINKNRSNATRLLGRLLFDLREKYGFDLITMMGGFKDNVIPREAEAELFISAANEEALTKEYNTIKSIIAEIMKIYQQELAASEPDLDFTVEDLGNDTYSVLDVKSFEKILFLLINMPYGVQVMSADIEGLVESSLNLGIFRIEEDHAEILQHIRSSKDSYKHYLSDRLNYMISFLGGDYVVRSEYPAWEFKKDSALREHFKKVYREMYGKDMEVAAIHAGLECGIIYEKMPGIDTVSIGPEMAGVHTVEEKLNILSAIRVYKFLEQIISEKF